MLIQVFKVMPIICTRWHRNVQQGVNGWAEFCKGDVQKIRSPDWTMWLDKAKIQMTKDIFWKDAFEPGYPMWKVSLEGTWTAMISGLLKFARAWHTQICVFWQLKRWCHVWSVFVDSVVLAGPCLTIQQCTQCCTGGLACQSELKHFHFFFCLQVNSGKALSWIAGLSDGNGYTWTLS